ncbi:hypothetical protein MNBD_GAMMA07-1410, partial [hydrothermal vent metagenome]
MNSHGGPWELENNLLVRMRSHAE